MQSNNNKRAIVLSGIVLAVVSIAALSVGLASGGSKAGGRGGDRSPPSYSSTPSALVPPPPNSAELARAARDRCDAAASHPSDPQRVVAGVSDDMLAPGAAIPFCEEAVALNPDNSRMHFQLGRAYRLGGRDLDAFAQTADAADKGYPIAFKYIGDAYIDGRGLPEGEAKSAYTALDWYNKAAAAHMPEAELAVAEAEQFIRKSSLDTGRFQNSEFIKSLYDGDFSQMSSPVALAYYTRGIIKSLDEENTIFIDQACKPAISMIGSKVIDVAVFASYIEAARRVADGSSEEQGKQMLVGGLSYVLRGMFEDQGKRDGVVLFDKDIYGCDSPVTKKILGNIMVNTRSN